MHWNLKIINSVSILITNTSSDFLLIHFPPGGLKMIHSYHYFCDDFKNKSHALALFWLLLDYRQIQQIEISSLLDKIVKALAMKILTEVGGKIDEYSENFNKKLENIKKKT